MTSRLGRQGVARSVPRWASLGLALVALLGAPRGAQAQAPDAERAAKLFKEGLSALTRGRVAEACPKFRASYELDPGPGTLFNLAECEERDGHPGAALEAIEELLRTIPAKHPKRGALEKRRNALEPQAGRLVLKLAPDAPSDTRVTRDGVLVARVGTAIAADVGKHAIVATSGDATRSFEVNVEKGAVAEVEVSPREATAIKPEGEKPAPSDGPRAAPTVPVAAAPPASSGVRTAGFVVGGVGVVGVGVGLVFGALVISKDAAVKDECKDETPCSSLAAKDAAAQGRTFSTVSTIAVGVGIAAVVAGTVMVIVGAPKQAASAGSARSRWASVARAARVGVTF